MASFAENMRAFTDDVVSCARERAATLNELSVQTEHLLSDTQSFVKHLGQQHQAMAKHVRSTLANDCRDRAEQVAELRHQIRTHLDELHKQVQDALRHCRNTRHEHLDGTFQNLRHQRQHLADDLREAGRIWRGESAQKPRKAGAKRGKSE